MPTPTTQVPPHAPADLIALLRRAMTYVQHAERDMARSGHFLAEEAKFLMGEIQDVLDYSAAR